MNKKYPLSRIRECNLSNQTMHILLHRGQKVPSTKGEISKFLKIHCFLIHGFNSLMKSFALSPLI